MDENITTGIVFQEEGCAKTNSLIVAQSFGKQHQHVIRSIKDLQTSVQNWTELFEESSYKDSYGRDQVMYVMNRDGFTLLAMGFTGDRAMEFKVKFLQAFNAMEKMLTSDDYILMRSQQILQRKAELLAQQVQMLEGEKTFLEQENKILAPKAQYTDDVLQSRETYTFEQMAKQLNFRSVQKFTQTLVEKKICYKRSDTYMLYAEYSGQGYTTPRTHKWVRSDGSIGSRTYTVWTERGRMFLHEKFNVALQPVDLTMFNIQ